MTLPWRILALILGVQTVANIGPMGLPAIAPLIRNDLLGVTLGPLVFGWAVEWVGGYRAAWIGLAASMVVALTLPGFF